MARVAKTEITDRSKYEFFVSRNEDGTANWSSDIDDRGVVHAFPDGWVDQRRPYSWSPTIVYNKPLDVYIMAAAGMFHTPEPPSCLVLYYAEKPWGPWTEFYWTSEWITDDSGDRQYEPQLSPKWISSDGKTMYLIFSDRRDGHTTNYKWNQQRLTLVVRPDL